jgi:hypothetical protein
MKEETWKWSERGEELFLKKIKNWIAHGICEPNLEWNSDKRQNREIIES